MTTIPGSIEARDAALAEWLERYEDEYGRRLTAANLATWQANVTGSDEDARRSTALDTELRQMHARPEAYAFLAGVRDAGGVEDPVRRRKLDIALRAHRAEQIPSDVVARTVAMEKALEHRFNTHRATLDGRSIADNEIRTILRTSDDVALRRRAWEASKAIGAAVADDLKALVRLRNASARTIGYPDYYAMMLELREIDAAELFGVLEQVERGTDPHFRAYRDALDARLAARFGIGAADVRPWHMADPFFQEAPAAEVSLDRYFAGQDLEALAVRFFDAIGLDVRDVLARSDLYEKPRKCQHAFCMSIDHAQDVRILCNLRPDEKWMGTLLHELGHAVYEKYADPALSFMLRTHAHVMTTEASAMLFGRLSRDAAWLEAHAGVPSGEAARIGAAAREAVRVQLLLSARWILAMCHMERALYADPEQDLDTLWWDLVERFQMLKRPEGRHAPDWASKIHFSIAPVYYHNYLLGEMTASQLERCILDRVLGGGADVRRRYVRDPRVGRFMVESVYCSGRRYDWRETLRRATGAALDPRHFIDVLAPGA